jgi:lysyl-tRNA synthetase class II
VKEAIMAHPVLISELSNDVEKLPTLDSISTEDPRYEVQGQVLQINDMGTARYLFLGDDNKERLAVFVNDKLAEPFAAAKSARLLDRVIVRGPLFRTMKGARGLWAESITPVLHA